MCGDTNRPVFNPDERKHSASLNDVVPYNSSIK